MLFHFLSLLFVIWIMLFRIPACILSPEHVFSGCLLFDLSLQQKSICKPLERGELASIPPSTDRLDQKDARIHLPSAKVNVITLVRESGCLGGDDLQVGIHAVLITFSEQIECSFRGGRRPPLLFHLFCQNIESNKVVLDLLECSQAVLAIDGHCRVIVGARALRDCTAPAAVVDDLRYRRAYSPEPAGPAEPI